MTMAHFTKRHFYTCGGETLSWASEWYTQPWFTTSRQHYDSLASLGPVDPPQIVIGTVPGCEAALSAQSSLDASRSAAGIVEITTTRKTTETVTSRYNSNGRTRTTTFGSVYKTGVVVESTPPPAVPATTTFTGVASTSLSGLVVATSIASRSSGSHAGSSFSSAPTSTTAVIATSSAVAIGSLSDPYSINTCAGGWDWQAGGTVAALGSGILFGGLVWLLWALLKGRSPGFFSPRSWFIPSDARPSRWSFLTFLLPFLRLPSLPSPSPLSEGQLSLHLLHAGLKLAALASLLALTASLPLLLAGVPCLSSSSPDNTLGGRLGTLTDLSLLRLLNALDPSPGSISTSSLLQLEPYKRALPSTISSAIHSARVRLIILLVIIAVLGVGGGLWIIARSYALLARYRRRFEGTICQGLDMVIIPGKDAVGWTNWSEERVRRWLRDLSKNAGGEERSEVEVLGVFGIPHVEGLSEKIKEREFVLNQLEMSETEYINSFHLVKTASNGQRLEAIRETEGAEAARARSPGSPRDYVAPREYYKLSSGRHARDSRERLNVPMPKMLPTSTGPKSRFMEMTRNSGTFSFRRFSLGQRVRIDSMGRYIPDPSPASERSNPLSSAASASFRTVDPPTPPVIHTPPAILESTSPTLPFAHRGSSTSLIAPTGDTPPSHPTSPINFPTLQPGPVRQTSIHSASPLAITSARPSQDASSPYQYPASPTGRHYSDIREYRAELKALNAVIMDMQEKGFRGLSEGSGNVMGWMVVGRGVRDLPFARAVMGRTREDVIWENVGREERVGIFRVKVAVMGLAVGILMVPIIALTVGAAPGFAHYLGLMRPLERSNGFGSGLVQGLIPAVLLCALVGLAIWMIGRAVFSFKPLSKLIRSYSGLARQVRAVSRTRQQFLAYKATVYFLLFTAVFCLILISALEYAVQGLTLGVQQGRSVGDGAVFSTWFIFILLLNLAIILPGLYLLRPFAAFRYWRNSKHAITPRQLCRRKLPSTVSPLFATLPCLIAVFYAFSLLFIFPLLAIPIILLLYLGYIATRHTVEYVQTTRSGGYTGAVMALWTIRRFGWVLGIQPFLFGLIMLSRREWAIGGVSIAVAVVAVILSEVFTVGFHPHQPDGKRSGTKTKFAEAKAFMSRKQEDEKGPRDPNPTDWDTRSRSHSSILQRVAALLPGYSRLPPDCPLPLPTENIDDLIQTERASYTRPDLAKTSEEEERDRRYFHDPTDSMRGLIYPPEMLAPPPVIWLPHDEAGVAEAEAADLGRHHNLAVIVDPIAKDREREDRRQASGGSAEVNSPLLSR